MESPTTIPLLPYADPPARSGVSCQRWPSGFRIVVPPVMHWRQLSGAYLWGLIPLFFFLFMVVAFISRPSARDDLWPSFALYGGILLLIAFSTWLKLHRRVVFDVTRENLSWYRLTASGATRGRRDLPRHDVVDVKLNAGNGKVLLRVRGQDFIEVDLSPNRQVSEFVVDELRRAVLQGEFAPVDGDDTFPLPDSNRTRRVTLNVAKAIVAFVVAPSLALLIFGGGGGASAFGCLGIGGGFVLVMILAGSSLGTQKKDFWF